MVFYAVLFTIPSIGALMWTQGKTQLSREQLLQTPTARARVRRAPAATHARAHATPGGRAGFSTQLPHRPTCIDPLLSTLNLP